MIVRIGRKIVGSKLWTKVHGWVDDLARTIVKVVFIPIFIYHGKNPLPKKAVFIQIQQKVMKLSHALLFFWWIMNTWISHNNKFIAG